MLAGISVVIQDPNKITPDDFSGNYFVREDNVEDSVSSPYKLLSYESFRV